MENERGTETLPEMNATEVPFAGRSTRHLTGPVTAGGWFLAEDLNGDPIVVRLGLRPEVGC